MIKNKSIKLAMVAIFMASIIVGCNRAVDQVALYDYENAEEYNQIVYSVKTGNIENIKGFIEKYPNLTKEYDTAGLTLLHYAVRNDQLEMARFLLENSAEVNAPSIENSTPLEEAEDYRASEEMIELLKEYGGDD